MVSLLSVFIAHFIGMAIKNALPFVHLTLVTLIGDVVVIITIIGLLSYRRFIYVYVYVRYI